MARIPILKKDGTPSSLFWSDQDDGRLKTVYRATDDGRVQRSRSMRYDAQKKRILKG